AVLSGGCRPELGRLRAGPEHLPVDRQGTRRGDRSRKRRGQRGRIHGHLAFGTRRPHAAIGCRRYGLVKELPNWRRSLAVDLVRVAGSLLQAFEKSVLALERGDPGQTHFPDHSGGISDPASNDGRVASARSPLSSGRLNPQVPSRIPWVWLSGR